MLCFSLEVPRALAEGALFVSSERILRWLPSGDGHPVVPQDATPDCVIEIDDDDLTGAPFNGVECGLYVTRGCGYWGPPVRLLAPLEITRVILRAA